MPDFETQRYLERINALPQYGTPALRISSSEQLAGGYVKNLIGREAGAIRHRTSVIPQKANLESRRMRLSEAKKDYGLAKKFGRTDVVLGGVNVALSAYGAYSASREAVRRDQMMRRMGDLMDRYYAELEKAAKKVGGIYGATGSPVPAPQPGALPILNFLP